MTPILSFIITQIVYLGDTVTSAWILTTRDDPEVYLDCANTFLLECQVTECGKPVLDFFSSLAQLAVENASYLVLLSLPGLHAIS